MTIQYPYKCGERVATHPATTAFMRGEHYGVVVGYTLHNLHDTSVRGVRVRLDLTGRVQVFHPDNLEKIAWRK